MVSKWCIVNTGILIVTLVCYYTSSSSGHLRIGRGQSSPNFYFRGHSPPPPPPIAPAFWNYRNSFFWSNPVKFEAMCFNAVRQVTSESLRQLVVFQNSNSCTQKYYKILFVLRLTSVLKGVDDGQVILVESDSSRTPVSCFQKLARRKWSWKQNQLLGRCTENLITH